MTPSPNQDDSSKTDTEHARDSAQSRSSPTRNSIRGSISSPQPLRPSSSVPEPKTPSPVSNSGKGKRKASEVEGNTPPDARKQRATFAADPRPHRASGTSSSSHAPSSYTRKRAKLSTAASTSAAGLANAMSSVGEGDATGSRPPSRSESQRTQNAGNTGTWSSNKSRATNHIPLRTQSRTSHRSQNQSMRSPTSPIAPSVRAASRQSKRGSISQASIPISALISPHAPSLSHNHASAFHMRDPRKPPRIQRTPWTLAFPQATHGERGFLAGRFAHLLGSGSGLTRTLRTSGGKSEDVEEQKDEQADDVGWYEGGGSPPHAWLFFLGFLMFPLWWIAGLFVKIPRTRRIEGGHDGQKSVVLDDPQVEHDAESWRTRCRIMALVSLVTYVPFIVLVAIFARRR